MRSGGYTIHFLIDTDDCYGFERIKAVFGFGNKVFKSKTIIFDLLKLLEYKIFHKHAQESLDQLVIYIEPVASHLNLESLILWVNELAHKFLQKVLILNKHRFLSKSESISSERSSRRTKRRKVKEKWAYSVFNLMEANIHSVIFGPV